jgi:hypothetical protein
MYELSLSFSTSPVRPEIIPVCMYVCMYVCMDVNTVLPFFESCNPLIVTSSSPTFVSCPFDLVTKRSTLTRSPGSTFPVCHRARSRTRFSSHSCSSIATSSTPHLPNPNSSSLLQLLLWNPYSPHTCLSVCLRICVYLTSLLYKIPQ